MSLYIIKQENSDYYKIGKSSSPDYRLLTLQIGNPNKLTIEYIKEGYGSLEGWIHEKFKKYRHIGEWFEFSPEMYAQLIYYIEVELEQELEEKHEQIKLKIEEYKEQKREQEERRKRWEKEEKKRQRKKKAYQKRITDQEENYKKMRDNLKAKMVYYGLIENKDQYIDLFEWFELRRLVSKYEKMKFNPKNYKKLDEYKMKGADV